MEISEAADLMDIHYLGWENKVDLDKLHMGDYETCLFGQVTKLRGLEFENAISKMGEPYDMDGPFGSCCKNPNEWKEEVKIRLKNKEIHDFKWAVLCMKAGKKVRRKNWVDKSNFYCFKNRNSKNLLTNHTGTSPTQVTYENLSATDWEVVADLFDDLEAGDKFEWVHEDRSPCVKVELEFGGRYYIYNNKVYACENVEVKKL